MFELAQLEDELCGCVLRREDMRSRFSGVKDCQKKGGAGYAARAVGAGCCSSAIVRGV